MYYCSVVSAQDLDGNNEAYAELIVLGEWGCAQRALEAGERELVCLLSTLVCPPSVIQLGPVACFAPSLQHCQSLGLLHALHPRQDPS